MQQFYFDNNIHKFLTKKHTTKEGEICADSQNRVNSLISKISHACDTDLERGFKSVWAPGLYLERTGTGRKLFTEITQSVAFESLIKPTTEEELEVFFTQVKQRVSELVKKQVKSNSFSKEVSKEYCGDAGLELINDFISRYNQTEKEALIEVYLQAEAVQQLILERLSNDFRKIIFHSCVKGFFDLYFDIKRDINLARLILDYSSLSKNIYKDKENRLLDPNKDLVDAELVHFAALGSWVDDQLKPVIAVTFDDSNVIHSRLVAFKSLSAWVIAHSDYSNPIPWGKVACIDKFSDEITLIDVKSIDIEPWVYSESSEKALDFLKMSKVSPGHPSGSFGIG